MFKRIIATCLFFIFSAGIMTQGVSAASFGVVESGANRVLVPIRVVADAFSVPVKWDRQKKMVTINEIHTLLIGSKQIKENGVAVKTMDVAPKVIQSTVYVPVREIGYLFKTPMNWNKQKQQLEFISNNQNYTIPAFPENLLAKPKVSATKKTVQVGTKSFSANVVTINLLAPNTSLHVELANNKLGSVSSLASIAKNHQAIAALNGNYFDAYTNSAVRLVYNGLVMNGAKVKPFDAKFTVFYYTKNGEVGIAPGATFMERFEKGDVQEALQVGPLLVKDGSVKVDPIAEGFKSHKILSSPGARSAIGILKNRQVIFVTVGSATVQQMASIMKQLGAIDAMNSDGGASSGLYVNGKYMTTPGREIAVALLVK